MSHSRQTEHYELPLYDGNDIINPLTDFNNANSSIDEALYNANQRSVQAENTANDAKDIAEGYDTRVSQAIQTADNAMTLANNTQDMIADDFDPNKAGGYKVGDFVIYNGKLYRFINAHTGAWDASDVQVSPVLIEAIADVVDEGKQAINDAVDEAEQEIAGQTEKVTKTQAMIAQPFDANKNGGYAVDDIVTYADKLYKFTSVHSGTWTGLDVEQVDVVEEINAVDTKVDNVDEKVDALELASKWKFFDSLTLGSYNPTHDLPSVFTELLFVFNYNGVIVMTVHMIKQMFDDYTGTTPASVFNGYYTTTNNNGSVDVSYNATQFSAHNCYLNGTAVNNDTTCSVYYR